MFSVGVKLTLVIFEYNKFIGIKMCHRQQEYVIYFNYIWINLNKVKSIEFCASCELQLAQNSILLSFSQ